VMDCAGNIPLGRGCSTGPVIVDVMGLPGTVPPSVCRVLLSVKSSAGATSMPLIAILWSVDVQQEPSESTWSFQLARWPNSKLGVENCREQHHGAHYSSNISCS
jgi:hypothetical protein